MHLLRSLFVLTSASVAVVTAAVLQPVGSSANTTTTVQCDLTIRSASGSFAYPSGQYLKPYVSYYATFTQAGHYAYCDFNEPAGAVYEMPCQAQLTPRVTGIATQQCPIADYNPISNVSYSVTRYGDRFVLQVDFADVGTGKHLTACETFSKSDFGCDGYYQYVSSRTLVADVGTKCPTS